MQAPAGHITADWDIIQACGIFAVSVSGHSSLPVLRNSMARAAVRCLQGSVTILPSIPMHNKPYRSWAVFVHPSLVP